MMAQPTTPTEPITGPVQAVNERGVRVAGAWYNVSRYHAVALPLKGAHVALSVKGSWIEALEVQDGPQQAPVAPEAASAPPVARERLIARESALRAAVDFLASRGDAKSPDVLRVAASFEAWLTRPVEEVPAP